MAGRSRRVRPPRAPRRAVGTGGVRDTGRPVRAVTSDLWYTLLYLRPHDQSDQERRRRKVWATPLERAGIPVARASRLVLRLESRCHGLEGKGRSFPVREQAAWLSRQSGVRVDVRTVQAQLDRLLERAPILVARGALETLDRWRSQGIQVGLVSNVVFESANGTRALLARKDLLSRFDSVYLSVEHPWGKPDPRAFRACLRELGVPPREAVHVGDRPWDVTGALRTGMRAIRFRRYRLKSDPPDYNGRRDGRPGVKDVHDWREVARAVERLRSTPYPVHPR